MIRRGRAPFGDQHAPHEVTHHRSLPRYGSEDLTVPLRARDDKGSHPRV